jgi:hypothetical protein
MSHTRFSKRSMLATKPSHQLGIRRGSLFDSLYRALGPFMSRNTPLSQDQYGCGGLRHSPVALKHLADVSMRSFRRTPKENLRKLKCDLSSQASVLARQWPFSVSICARLVRHKPRWLSFAAQIFKRSQIFAECLRSNGGQSVRPVRAYETALCSGLESGPVGVAILRHYSLLERARPDPP